MSSVPNAQAMSRSSTRRTGAVAAVLSTPQGLIGTIMIAVVLLIVIGGPLVAPHSSSEFVGKPYTPPSDTAWLGTDYQGHDVLSVVLNGGLMVIGLSAAGVILSIGCAAAFGLFTGAFPGRVSTFALRVLDLLLIFPPVVLALLVLTRAGSSPLLLLALTVVTQFPPSARVFWAASRAVAQEDYVEFSRSLGVGKWELMFKEIAPNILAPVLAEIPIRFAYCVAIVTILAFLGFGSEPPAIDWGTMINQNKGGLTLQPWPVVAPVACIAVIAVGANLLADALRARITSTSGSGTI